MQHSAFAIPLRLASFKEYLKIRPPSTGLHEKAARLLIERLPDDLQKLPDLHRYLDRWEWEHDMRVAALDLHRSYRKLRREALEPIGKLEGGVTLENTVKTFGRGKLAPWKDTDRRKGQS